MRRLLYITLFLSVLISCKKDSFDYMPSMAEINSLGGKWYLTEVERVSIDNKNVWEKVPAAATDTLMFRSDGVILYADGLPMCCSPKSLLINGRLIDIKPQFALPANDFCAKVNCAFCPLWELTVNQDEMIISSCNNFRRKFVR
ncbi:hypothetical protein DYBT9623_02191 [Dyadobacter sp. CECT 9623]|uniref:Lipocalin-like domain-containing protein n=1 Tax=Dyadobacter linearis TaxID=2823330 RepID=A0ABM8UPP3_9BACT|nr:MULTISPECIES: hypothetical protein [unclassified Dyadobacter]MCE7059066.1 hypothetical protein [Dyadobacter sp. CY343]CAG5069455.1 hypothetical protein DYBT9623_02191 [Dyadobacter sp. CECT 9623]